MARLYYPAGRYTLTSTLRVPSGALLCGDGHDTVFVATGDFPAITVLDTDGTFTDRATGTAASRFLCPNNASVVIPVNGSRLLWYDGTSSRWRVFGPVA